MATLGMTGCLGEQRPTPLDYTVTGVWELEASPFGSVEEGSVPLKAELEELGGGLVDVRSSWQGIPVHAKGRRSGDSVSIHLDSPRLAKGLIVATFDGERVHGNAEGIYWDGRHTGRGKAVFSGDRTELEVGRTGVDGVDTLGDALQRAVGAVYATPDTLGAGSVGLGALIAVSLLVVLGGLARFGRTGRAVLEEGEGLHTRVLKGQVAAGHLAYFEYVRVDDEGYVEAAPKLAAFDPATPASEDGVRGIRYRVIEEGGRALVAVPDLVVIVELL